MRLIKVSSNKSTFKVVSFDDGFNVVIADKDKDSTAKDSRNGLGKSLLVEIVDFCLGANPSKTLKKEEMISWSFSLELEINDSVFVFSRAVEDSNYIHIEGDVTAIELPENTDGLRKYSVDNLKPVLGKAILGLLPSTVKGKKNAPSYRSLISYFIRTDGTAFNDPFAYFAQQPAWNKQVNNAFLLGLDWELASKFHTLRTKLDELTEINKAIENGALNDFGGTIGELESEKINLETKLNVKEGKLRSFKVHEQYHEIQERANELTKETHTLLNQLNLNTQIVDKYQNDLKNEDGSKLRVEEIYNEAGLIFTDRLKKNLEDVQKFHETIVTNRKDYLQSEIAKLTAQIIEDRAKVKELTEAKAKHMKILQSHGALEEFALLQGDVNEQQAQVEDIKSKISRLSEVEDSISKLSVEIEQLMRTMRKDYSERLPNLASAVQMFNANSEYLYSESGTLSVDVGKNGYKLKVDIKKSGSDGVGSMKVFCYDLMLAEYWSTIKARPITLVHDSKLFDGVDGRQVAKALEIAKKKSEEFGFQYICTINSDAVPLSEFSDEFKSEFEDSVKVRYHDKDDTGTLLGVSF